MQGSQILSTLATHPAITSIHAFTRKKTPTTEPDSKVTYISDTDSSSWSFKYPKGVPLFFSALGTTARQAGGFEKQRKIDYDLNVELAKAAKEAGVTVYVLISTSGASPTSSIPYSKMKGELDETVKQLGFKHTIILKPGLLVGTRGDSRPGEFVARKVATILGAVSGNVLKDPWAQDAEVVARAAVSAALEAISGKRPEGATMLGQSDIVRLGREEWVNE